MKKYKPVTPPEDPPQFDKTDVEGRSWIDIFAEKMGPVTIRIENPQPEEPAIKPYPGLTEAESNELFEVCLANLQDLAKNAESKDIRKRARKYLRERDLPLKGTIWNPGNYNPTTYSPPETIQLPPEQIEYIKKVAREAGFDLDDL